MSAWAEPHAALSPSIAQRRRSISPSGLPKSSFTANAPAAEEAPELPIPILGGTPFFSDILSEYPSAPAAVRTALPATALAFLPDETVALPTPVTSMLSLPPSAILTSRMSLGFSRAIPMIS